MYLAANSLQSKLSLTLVYFHVEDVCGLNLGFVPVTPLNDSDKELAIE
jgi:hypothetical protein